MPTLQKRILVALVVVTSGCASNSERAGQPIATQSQPRTAAIVPQSTTTSTASAAAYRLGKPSGSTDRFSQSPSVISVSHRLVPDGAEPPAQPQDEGGTGLPPGSFDDRSGQHALATASEPSELLAEQPAMIAVDQVTVPMPVIVKEPTEVSSNPVSKPGALEMVDVVELNLPSVLAAIDGSHPVVGFARWQVQQAYANLARAEALWLPSIQAGFSFDRHDGNYQASDGSIIDVNRNSFQYGLGMGATGAGTTPRPGLIAQFHLADAIFEPKVARKQAWSRSHAACATLNDQLLAAGLAYLELVDAYQDQRIIEESRERFSDLATITIDFAEAGEGLQADADRLRTERSLVENRLTAARERSAVASARLAQAISLDGSSVIFPMDTNAVPLDMVTAASDRISLIGTALATRPELKESQTLVAAAWDAYQREKIAPFVPSILVGFSTGGFGGGLGNNLDDVAGRYDFDALMSWEVRNLGCGEHAARRGRLAQVQQANFEKLRVMDQVTREVSEGFAQVGFRQRQIEITRDAIAHARDSYRRNLERIRDGQGLPLEVLQSVQALETAERTYLQAIIGYNRAQLRLQWALGWPVSAASVGQDPTPVRL
jgi:outer membrane protein TolC